MFARVTRSQILPGKFDEAIRINQDSVAPAAKQQKGFRGMYGLSDRNTGTGITISLWETEADMKACEASGYYQQQLAKFKDFFAAPPVREEYEVTAQA